MEASTGTINDLTWTGSANSITFSVNSGKGHMQLSQLMVKRATSAPDPIRGDVNGDGTVDVADIAAIIDVMAGTTVPGTSAAGNADVNGDGTVDVADIASVIDIMAGVTPA